MPDDISIEQQFFIQFFYSHFHQAHSQSIASFSEYLKEKFKPFKQISYNTPKSMYEVNFIKKYLTICQYVPFVSNNRVQKLDFACLQEIIDNIYDDFLKFFIDGGWKLIKNKSMCCRIQEYLLIKLNHTYSLQRSHRSFDRYLLAFFFTLNYFKTCNYEIKLFGQFLNQNYDLDMFFMFIILRRKSRRVAKVLVIRTQFLQSLVKVLRKGSQTNTPLQSFQSKQSSQSKNQNLSEGVQEITELKLLLTFYNLMQFIRENEIVLHQMMIVNILKCADILEQTYSIMEYGCINWKQFLQLHFNEICKCNDKSYQYALIGAIIEKNIQIANHMFQPAILSTSQQYESQGTHQKSANSQNTIQNQREQYLEDSFNYLINQLQQLFYGKQLSQSKSMYSLLKNIFEFDVILVNKISKKIFKTEAFIKIMKAHQPSLQLTFPN